MTIKNYLVTGSEGFVGFNLSNHIKKLGHNVFGVDLNNGKDNLKNWRKLQLDNSGVKTFNVAISDKYQIQDFENNIKDVHFQGIFHLAGLAGVRKSLEIPKKYYDVNLRGTLNVLNLSKKSAMILE